MTAAGVFPKVASDRLSYVDLNKLYDLLPKVLQVYTGTGFNTSGVQSNSVELNDYSASDVGSSDYLMIEITATFEARSGVSSYAASASCDLRIEAKELGGAYSDVLATTTVQSTTTPADGSGNTNGGPITRTIKIIHTLTAGQKSNGVKLRITGTSTHSNGGAAITNIQTIVTRVGDF